MPQNQVTAEMVADYQAHGAILVRGVFSDWIPELIRGAQSNLANPSDRAIVHRGAGQGGQFLEDFCSWERIRAYRDFVYNSPLGSIAAALMQSETAQFFHDHFLHKEASTPIPTPWHQDMPYYFVDGEQTASFWIPLQSRPREVSLKCVAGSHHWPSLIRPTSWSSNESFYQDDEAFMDLPDIDNAAFDILSWEMEPGDAVVFNFKTVHGANANTLPSVNQTLSFRLVGDDVRYIQRPGRTSPNFPEIDQENGQRLREDWFPLVFPAVAHHVFR
jgi:ectoine hydroxylase-related dioxygenase (phytanoyl-CoA dioxygenase family)